MKRFSITIAIFALFAFGCSQSSEKQGKDIQVKEGLKEDLQDLPTDQNKESDTIQDKVEDKITDLETTSKTDTKDTTNTEQQQSDTHIDIDPNRQPKTAVVSDPDKAPYAIHLTWVDQPSTSVVIQWLTKDQKTDSWCWFAKEDEIKENKDDDTVSMPVDDKHIIHGEVRDFQVKLSKPKTKDRLHYVMLNNLEKGTTYYYRCGELSLTKDNMVVNVNLSALYKFHTPEDGDTTSFVVFGDSRGGYEILGKLANYTVTHYPDVDFYVFDGDYCTIGMFEEWQKWFKAMDPVDTTHVLVPVVGNHEELTFSTYKGLFVLPKGAGKIDDVDLTGLSFSYDIGPVHLTILDSNTDDAVKKVVSWLDNDLSSTTKPWKVVTLHHPAYSSGNHGNTPRVDEYLVPIFEKNHVDFVFNGHDHDYERTKPIKNGAVDETDGVVYITTGGAGAPLYNVKGKWFTAYSRSINHFIVCKATQHKFDLTAYDEDGVQFDHYEKKK